jgi:site-specific DNA recombinase
MQAVGKFVFSLLANLAEFDRATLLGRTILGVRRLANQGKFISGPVPFGFTVRADGFLAPSELMVTALGITEADLVREIFQRVADGASTLDVTRWLNRECVAATKRFWRKGVQQSREASPGLLGWQPIRIWRMIRAPIYRGVRERRIGNGLISNDLPFALVEAALWSAANAAIGSPARRVRVKTANAEPYLLAGLIRCRACMDATVTGRARLYSGWTATRSSGKYAYYRCSGASHGGGKFGILRCPSANIPANALEEAVIAAVDARIQEPETTLEALRASLRTRLGQAADGVRQRRARWQASPEGSGAAPDSRGHALGCSHRR